MNGMSGANESPSLQHRLADGDPTAFTEAYDLFGRRLYRTAVRYLGCAIEAEDVVQELFVALVRSRDHLDRVDNLASYLFVSLRRLVGRVSDDRRRRPKILADDSALTGSNTDLALVDLRESLEVALKQLPDEQREVVILKIDSELTFAEIAQVLQISLNTAASRYRYALEKLRAVLTREGVGRGRRD